LRDYEIKELKGSKDHKLKKLMLEMNFLNPKLFPGLLAS
jgi:hypothetical protein